MKNLTSFFKPQHKFRIRNNNAPSFSGNNDYFLYDERQGFKKSQRDIPKGFIKPDIPAEPAKEPDYLYQNFGQYSWPEESYRNSNQPFFTGKDPLDNFIKPAKAPVGNSFPVNNEADFEAQNGFQEANGNRGKSPEEIIKEVISQRPLDYKEFYGEPEGEIQQNIQYQDGTEEIIKQVMKNTFPCFEITEGINEVKATDDIGQNQDLSQQEINNEDTTPAPEPQEPQSDAEMQGITPMADTMEPKDLEGIVEAEQLQPEEMMQKPLPDPFDPLAMPGFFGP